MTRPLPVPRGRNRYCGPFAAAVALGCTTDEAAAKLRAASGRAAIRRIFPHELERALRCFGLRQCVSGPALSDAVTLGQFLRAVAAAPTVRPRLLVVMVTGHYLVYCNGKVADNRTREWRPWREFPGLRRRVIEYGVLCGGQWGAAPDPASYTWSTLRRGREAQKAARRARTLASASGFTSLQILAGGAP